MFLKFSILFCLFLSDEVFLTRISLQTILLQSGHVVFGWIGQCVDVFHGYVLLRCFHWMNTYNRVRLFRIIQIIHAMAMVMVVMLMLLMAIIELFI